METVSGILLKESIEGELPSWLKIVKTEEWDVENAGPHQPKQWTALSFEANTDDPKETANLLSGTLSKGPWYTNFSADDQVFIIFPGKVFQYRKSDTAGREAAQDYGRSINIPESQLDWEE